MGQPEPTVAELVVALRTLGCETADAAADVLRRVDVLHSIATREEVLRRMGEVERQIIAQHHATDVGPGPPACEG